MTASPKRASDDMPAEQPKPQRRSGSMASHVATPPIFVDRETAAAALSLSASTFMREVRSGAIAAPRLLSKGRCGWLWSDLLAYAAARPAADLPPPPKTNNRRGSDTSSTAAT